MDADRATMRVGPGRPPIFSLWHAAGLLTAAIAFQSGFWPVHLLNAVLWVGLILKSVQAAALHLDQSAIMLIDRRGIELPCAYGAFIPHEVMDACWIEHHHGQNTHWRTLSIQCAPRQALATDWWRRLNGIRTDTLLEGDIVFHESSVDLPLEDICALLEYFRNTGASGANDAV